MNDSEVIIGLNDAASAAGVSITTLYRWLSSGLFTEEEAYKASDKSWVIDRDALNRVRKDRLEKSRGAFKARNLRFHNTPKGYAAIRLSDLSDELLTGYLFELSETYEEHLSLLSTDHKRSNVISDKMIEVFKELLRRGIRLNTENNPTFSALSHI